jgi:hypothetical protein
VMAAGAMLWGTQCRHPRVGLIADDSSHANRTTGVKAAFPACAPQLNADVQACRNPDS